MRTQRTAASLQGKMKAQLLSTRMCTQLWHNEHNSQCYTEIQYKKICPLQLIMMINLIKKVVYYYINASEKLKMELHII